MRSVSLVLPLLMVILTSRTWAGDHAEAAYYADAYARHYHVPTELVHAIIRQESNWNRHAISNDNALGLMQLMPDTATRFGVWNPFDMSQNVGGGVRYLHALLDQYHGDMRLAVAAYLCSAWCCFRLRPRSLMRRMLCPAATKNPDEVDRRVIDANNASTVARWMRFIPLTPSRAA